MWSLSMHAAEFVARAVLVYFAIMLLVRLSGKRTIGEFTAFDMVVVLLIGEATQGALTGGDESVGGALIVCATLVLLNYGTAFLGSRFALFDKLIEGEPVVLVRHGRVFRQSLRRNNLPESDLAEALRRNGVLDVEDVELAVLETDGTISVVKRSETRSR
jgi:uncharacterized membrane protein YcaP (DUF421 family)